MNGLVDYFCFHRKFLIYNLMLRNLKIRYRKSFFGMLWTILIPAGTAAIYYMVFHFVLKVSIPHYLLFIVSGIIPWTFVTSGIGSNVETLVHNYSLLNKVPLPPHSLVLADNLTSFLNLLLSLPILLVIQYFSLGRITFSSIQYIPLLFVLFLTIYAIGLVLALTYVYFRDLKYLVTLILQFWFYLTPVMYQTKMIPEEYLSLLYLNPVGILFTGFHNSVISEYWLSGTEWASILGWCLIVNIISYAALRRMRYKIVEML